MLEGANSRSRFYWLLLIFVFLTAWLLQTQSQLNTDVSWAMHAAEKILQGGKYYTDVFEPNPPLVFYLAFPSVLAAKFFHISFIVAARIYIFFTALVSLLICRRLANSIFLFESHFFNLIFQAGIIAIFFLLPGLFFGEREHFTLLLTLPYALLVVKRALNIPVSYKLAVLVGALGGLGFALKPFFLTTLLLFEIYLLWKRKDFFSWLRIETFVVGGVLIIYLVSIFVFMPEYLHQMIPYALYMYSPYYTDKLIWLELCLEPASIYCLVGVLFIYRLKVTRNSARNELKNILVLGVIGFFLSYMSQLMYVGYHELPMLGFATLLFILIWYEYFHGFFSTKYTARDLCFVLVVGILLLGIPIQTFYLWTKEGISKMHEKTYNRLLQYAKTHANGESVYFFSTSLTIPYPLVDYANLKFHSRFPALWSLPSLYFDPTKKMTLPKMGPSVTERQKFLIDAVTSEMAQHPPRLVFICPHISWRFITRDEFDYIAFFSANPEFKELWKNYRYATSFGIVDVYTRI